MCLMPEKGNNVFCLFQAWVISAPYFVESVSDKTVFSVDRVKHGSIPWPEVWFLFLTVMSGILSNHTSYVKVQSEKRVNYSATNWLLVHHWEWWLFKTQFQVECCQLSISNVTRSAWNGCSLRSKSKVMLSLTSEIHSKPHLSVTFHSQRGQM